MQRKSRRHGPLVRALDLLSELASRRFGMDMGEIQDHLGVSRREAYRYLDALADAGVKIDKRKEPGGARGGFVWRWLYRLVDVRGMKFTRVS